MIWLRRIAIGVGLILWFAAGAHGLLSDAAFCGAHPQACFAGVPL